MLFSVDMQKVVIEWNAKKKLGESQAHLNLSPWRSAAVVPDIDKPLFH